MLLVSCCRVIGGGYFGTLSPRTPAVRTQCNIGSGMVGDCSLRLFRRTKQKQRERRSPACLYTSLPARLLACMLTFLHAPCLHAYLSACSPACTPPFLYAHLPAVFRPLSFGGFVQLSRWNGYLPPDGVSSSDTSMVRSYSPPYHPWPSLLFMALSIPAAILFSANAPPLSGPSVSVKNSESTNQ